MKIRFTIMVIIGFIIILTIILFSYNGNDKVSNFYYRLDNDTAKCFELNKSTNEIILSNWSNNLGPLQWNGTYKIKGNKLIESNETFGTTEWTINEDSITANIITSSGEYKNVTYKSGTKEDFNKLVEKLKKGS